MMKTFIVCRLVVRSRYLKTTTILILSTTVLTSCSLIINEMNTLGSTYELNPVKKTGCIGDYNNPCRTIDITTSNDRTGVCSELTTSGWAYRANKYMVKSTALNNYKDWNGVFPRPGSGRCKYFDRHHTLVEGEYALTFSSNMAFMTISGDICSTYPTINIHRHEGDWLIPHHVRRYNKARMSEPERHTDPIYPFYIGSHSAPWINKPNGIEKNLIFVKELIAKQCSVVPNEIRISGRFTPPPQKKRRSMELAVKYASYEIYTGTYFPNASGIKLTHDDTIMAKAQYDLALSRKQAIDRKIQVLKRAAKERLDKAKVGGAILFGILFGLHQTSICNDPNLTEAEKPYYF